MRLVMLFLTLLLLKLGDCRLSITLKVLSPSKMVREGYAGPFILCTARGGVFSLSLFHVNHKGIKKKVVSTPRFSVEVSAGNRTNQLLVTIKNATIADAGLYICKTNGSESGTPQETIYVANVPPSDSPPSVTGSDAPVTNETSDGVKGSSGLLDLLYAIAVGGALLLIVVISVACRRCCTKPSCNICYECCLCSGDSTDATQSRPKRPSSLCVHDHDGLAEDEFGQEGVAHSSEGLAATTIKPGAPQAKPSKNDDVAGDFPPDASENGAYETVGRKTTKTVANAQQTSPPSDFNGKEEERPHVIGGRGPRDAWKPPETSLVTGNPGEPSPPPDDQAYAPVDKSKKRKSSRKSSRNADPQPPPPSGEAYAIVAKARKNSKSCVVHMQVGRDEHVLKGKTGNTGMIELIDTMNEMKISLGVVENRIIAVEEALREMTAS